MMRYARLPAPLTLMLVAGILVAPASTLEFQPTQAGPSRQFQFSARVRF